MRVLALVRHSESIKNMDGRMSSIEDDEALTDFGRISASELASSIKSFMDINSIVSVTLHCAKSRRAIETANAIGREINVNPIPNQRLVSRKSGLLAGLSEREMEKLHPNFLHQMHLHRAGILSSYEMSYPKGSESPCVFETRVETEVSAILAESASQLVILVAHRSPITATLVRFARQFHRYPSNYYGHIPLGLSGLSLVVFSDCIGSGSIYKVNALPAEVASTRIDCAQWTQGE